MARARPLPFALLILLAVAARAPCQETTGKRADITFDMTGLRASLLDVGAGLDIARFLGLGVRWGMGMDDPGVLDLQIGVWAAANLLSEGEMGLPVTLVIRGAFSKVRSLGDALAGQDLVRSGTVGSVGFEVSRTFAAAQKVGFRAAIEASYTYSTMTTEAIAGSGSAFDTLIVPAAQLLYGIRLDLVLAMTEHLGFVMGIRTRLDGAFRLHYGPTFALVTR
jgi:hypothetical protein